MRGSHAGLIFPDHDIDLTAQDVSPAHCMASEERATQWKRVGGSIGADGTIAGITRET